MLLSSTSAISAAALLFGQAPVVSSCSISSITAAQAHETSEPPEESSSEQSEYTGAKRPTPAQDLLRQLEEGGIRGPDGEPLTAEQKKALQQALESGEVTTFGKPPPRDGGSGIIVRAKKPRGSVPGDLEPVQSLNPDDIRAFGVDNIAELIEVLGPEVRGNGSTAGSGPVVLLNGKRVSSFLEIATIPAEAIERMEIFPVEAALQYGFSPTQRVVNVVTYEHFKAKTGLANGSVATSGGYETTGVNFNYFQIDNDTRYTFDISYDRNGSLLESERGVRQVGGPSELGDFRTLLPSSQGISLNGTVNARLGTGVSSTFNAQYTERDQRFLLGRSDFRAVARDIGTSNLNVGAVVSGLIDSWNWSVFANYQRFTSRVSTDQINGVGARGNAKFLDESVDVNALFSGRMVALPAGPVTASIRLGGQRLNSASEDSSPENATEISNSLNRGVLSTQASLDIPILYRGLFGPDWMGNLSANVNYSFSDLSDFGAIEAIGYGTVWAPVKAVNFIASVSHRETAPTPRQLNAPAIRTGNVRAFDFLTGQTVEFTQIAGGNSMLKAEDQETARLGLRIKPFERTNLLFDIDYLDVQTKNSISAFPTLTPPIETAFPDRVTRDQTGQLISIDTAPINFVRSGRKQLRWGAIFSRPLGGGSAEDEGETLFFGSREDMERSLPPGAIVVDAAPGSAQARRFDTSASRVRLSLYHSVTFKDEILVSEDGLRLNLLEGDAIRTGGGSPRHVIQFQASVSKKGLGARVDANWQSGTLVRGVPVSSSGNVSDLRFSDLATFDLSLFANVSDQFSSARVPNWLKGVRFNLDIVNLFNERQTATDINDLTPLNFQPAFLDPEGRRIMFSIRKLF